jgi:mannose-6-phosphate isomerase-like protein (cupin superfamily)
MNIISSPLAGQLLANAGANLVMVEWTAEGCTAGAEPMKIAPLHIHHEDDEAWYILKGTLGFQIGEQILEAQAGDAVIAPRGAAHTYWNPGTEEARYLLIMTTRINELIEAIHSTSDRSMEAMKQLFERYESELLEL